MTSIDQGANPPDIVGLAINSLSEATTYLQ